MYIRKSSESEDRQALSIPAQERELRELAERRGYVVVGQPIAESMSAKRPGRPGFAELLRRLESGEADGILCWHLDRLARNPIDGGQIMWAQGQRSIRVIATPDREYEGTPDDKMLMSIIFGMATKYSDDLAKNVMRGTREALQRGLWPGKYKFGYMRDAETGLMVPDPQRWNTVRQLWSWRLDGVSVQEIHRRAAHELGLTRPRSRRRLVLAKSDDDATAPGNDKQRTDWRALPRPGGGPITRGSVYHLLSDSFYAGQMVYAGETYEGKHQSMVTAGEFKQVQAMEDKRAPATPALLPFAYRGLIHCGACGAQVTAERHTNRQGHKYVHYHCTRKRKNVAYCPERSVTEAEIDGQIAAFLAGVNVPDTLVAALVAEVESQVDALLAQRDEQVGAVEAEAKAIDTRLERLRELVVDGVVTPEDYARDRGRMVAARQSLRETGGRGLSKRALLEPLQNAVLRLKTVANRYPTLPANKKLAVVRELCSNLSLKDRNLLITATKPVSLLMEVDRNSPWWAVKDAARTYLADATRCLQHANTL